jgi:hypothetical protein
MTGRGVGAMLSLLGCTRSFACAIFLVLKLDSPFAGRMGIRSQGIADE